MLAQLPPLHPDGPEIVLQLREICPTFMPVDLSRGFGHAPREVPSIRVPLLQLQFRPIERELRSRKRRDDRDTSISGVGPAASIPSLSGTRISSRPARPSS